MFARLTALVSSSSGLPFELGEPHRSAWGTWTHYRATAKADGSAVSVFRVSAQSKQDPKLVAARNGVKRLKMVGGAGGEGWVGSSTDQHAWASSRG